MFLKKHHKKTILPFFFGLAVVAFLIFNWKTITGLVDAQTTNLTVAQDMPIYKDQMMSGFANWSWNSVVDLQKTQPVFEGQKSIAFTPSAWGGLYFHTDTAVDLTQYATLHFYMLPTNQTDLQLVVYDQNNQAKPGIALSRYVASPSTTVWNEYSVPMNDLLPLTSSAKGFAIQDASGKGQPLVYVDNVALLAKTSATTNNDSSTYNVYADSLTNGWDNWSWDSNVNYSNTYPVDEGTNSISYTANAAWGGLYLHTNTAFDLSPYNALVFSAKASTDNQKYALLLYGDNDQLLHDPISLDLYGGQPVSSTWKEYSVPLADFNATGKKIKGIGINDLTGHAQPAVYIDSVQLKKLANLPSTGGQVKSITIMPTPTVSPTQTPSPTGITAQPSPTATQTVQQATSNSGDPLAGDAFFNNPDSNPAQSQADQWRASRPADADALMKIAGQPKAIWMGGWSGDIHSAVQNIITKASQANQVPVFIAYNIPFRDCGSYSAGGSSDAQAYRDWISNFASGIGNKKALVVVEPDALAGYTCLPADGQQQRLDLLKFAVQTFKALGNTSVYLDAGHSGWVATNDMASRLKQAGIDQADGFALNVSNFDSTDTSISYGQQISGQIGGKHFIVDTSRNGNGPSGSDWCNPSGRALGTRPTTQTGNSMVDAFLWLKYPGESDGSCNGGPSAGTWYPDFALGLAQRAGW